MTPEQAAQIAVLVEAQAQARDRLTNAAAGAVRRLLAGFDAWYDGLAVRALVTRIVRIVEAAQRQIAAVTSAYLARVATITADRQIAPVALIVPATLRRGVTHDVVYGRLAEQFRFQRSKGVDPARALQIVLSRADAVVEMDAALAARGQAHQFMVVREVDGFRRVVHPELSRGGSCGLCIVASGRVYSREDLLPLHARCRCETLPIVNGVDPGSDLNASTLRQLYEEAGSNRAAELKRTRYKVRPHGELGPVLTDARYDWRSPADVAKDAAA